MILGEFFKKADKQFFNFNSQTDYISSLFKKAGINKEYSRDYLKHLYLGAFPFSADCKACFPDKIDQREVSDFFKKHVMLEKRSKLYESFGIIASEVDQCRFFVALARQFIEIVKAPDGEEADDIVVSEYEQLTTNSSEKSFSSPLYKNDSALCTGMKTINLQDIYATCKYTWKIRNVGKVDWYERKLVFVNANDSRVKAKDNEIIISELQTGKEVDVSTEFQGRGFEGHFICHWELQNKDGVNCFPDSSYFDVKFNIEFCV